MWHLIVIVRNVDCTRIQKRHEFTPKVRRLHVGSSSDSQLPRRSADDPSENHCVETGDRTIVAVLTKALVRIQKFLAHKHDPSIHCTSDKRVIVFIVLRRDHYVGRFQIKSSPLLSSPSGNDDKPSGPNGAIVGSKGRESQLSFDIVWSNVRLNSP